MSKEIYAINNIYKDQLTIAEKLKIKRKQETKV